MLGQPIILACGGEDPFLDLTLDRAAIAVRVGLLSQVRNIERDLTLRGHGHPPLTTSDDCRDKRPGLQETVAQLGSACPIDVQPPGAGENHFGLINRIDRTALSP